MTNPRAEAGCIRGRTYFLFLMSVSSWMISAFCRDWRYRNCTVASFATWEISVVLPDAPKDLRS